jgi:hypothetical protein
MFLLNSNKNMQRTDPTPSFDPETRTHVVDISHEFTMLDASGSVMLQPEPMTEPRGVIYDVGAPLAEINAGRSRFIVFREEDNGVVLALAKKGAAQDSSGVERFRVDRSAAWPLTENPLLIGRTDKPGETDRAMSASHFHVSMDSDGMLVIADVGSMNGTSVRAQSKTQTVAYMSTNEMPPETVGQEFLEELRTNRPAELTKQVIREMPEQMTPTKRVVIGDKTFYLTDIFSESDGYKHAVMYTSTEVDGETNVVSRLLYMSKSDGGWRITYGVEGRGRYIKESRDDSHYTQETKLMRQIVDALEEQVVNPDETATVAENLRGLFSIGNENARELMRQHEEITYYRSPTTDAALGPARAVTAGHMGSSFSHELHEAGFDTFTDYFGTLDGVYPTVLPDMRYPRATYQTKHTLLGEISVDEYDIEVDGRTVTWAMAHDIYGRSWVDNVFLADSEVSSYGTRAEVLDAGCFTNKPYEYPEQATLLSYGSEKVDAQGAPRYVDITPLLTKLLPVAFYMAARGIDRSALEQHGVDTL